MMKSRLGTSAAGGLRAGFSLLELVAVLVIIGVVAALSVAKIPNAVAQQKVAGAASGIQSDVETAFVLAGRNRVPIRLVWTASSSTLKITNRTGTVTFRTTPIGSAYGLTSSQVTFSTSSLEIYPSGLAADTLLATISVTRGSLTLSRRVHVSRSGMVRID